MYPNEPVLDREDEGRTSSSSGCGRSAKDAGPVGAAPPARGGRLERELPRLRPSERGDRALALGPARPRLPGARCGKRGDPVADSGRTSRRSAGSARSSRARCGLFFSMTEPDVSGSDPTTLRTRAVRDGDEWVIDGHKWFSSGAEGASFGIVMAVTDPDDEPHRRATQIIVPADTPGVEVVRAIPTMGHRGRGWTTHCEVRYTGVRVPVENTLGEVGDGFRIAQKRLGPGRIHHVMRWLGQMQRAFELMCTYALERETFGGPLAEKQTVQNWIADSAAEIQACRLMTLDAAHKIDQGDEARVEVSVIKFYAAKRAQRRHRSCGAGARRAGAHGRDAAGGDAFDGPRCADLRRPGRGAPHGRRAADPQVVRRGRRLALRVAADPRTSSWTGSPQAAFRSRSRFLSHR